jgi:hypothetical protein
VQGLQSLKGTISGGRIELFDRQNFWCKELRCLNERISGRRIEAL